ncbi:uncharacterized protein LOC123556872 [Mercenaria mercenaria]|uniref:uncharacterized protein LOC123556872 n=1 Tax=Mercenaria mercenaria TaxID=6596 RepID=UPI00234E91CE|nr:uncharacterized protein LOC123556872 [Mercenaria mercenaria]
MIIFCFSLKQIIRSKDELEKQYLAEKEHLQRKYEEEKQAKEEALKRLSSIASSKLRDKNPNITDLSDQNRPTKIAEKMSELYDNQWTDAFDVLEGKMDERQVIQTLLDTLMRVSRECRRLSEENFFERVQRSIESPIEATGMPKTTLLLSDQLKQQIKEFRKIRAAAVVKDVEKIIKSRILLPNHPATEVQDYLSRCVEIGWFCAVQDPPLILSAQSPVEFDTNTFKDYTKRGKYVEYVVWPAMYLHEGGALLAKGIAQGSDHKPTSTRGYAEYTQAPLQKTSVQAAPAARITSRNQGGQRHHPPLTLPDQQRQNIHLQSDGFSSSKVRIPGNTQKSQTVYSTRRTTEMNASQTVYGRRGYAVGTASHSTDF